MIKLSTLVSLLFLPLNLMAANWYVRPSATGAKTGADWDNAWAINSIGWAKVTGGDTVWLAGGSYGGLTTGASGSANNSILIRRVLSSDKEASAAAGWNSSFDSQVQLSQISVPGQSWVTIDGRQKSGIVVTVGGSGGNGMSGATSGSIDHITVRFIEFVGPNKTTGLSYGRYGINLAPSNNKVTNLTIQDCWIHIWCEALRACNWDTVTIERCIISDTSTDNIDHSDIIYSYPSKNVTFRNNSIFKSPEDGMFHEFGGAVNFKFYGNIFWDTNWHMIFFKTPGNYGPIYFINNVFAGRNATSNYGYISSNGCTIASGSVIRNNVFLNTTNDFGSISDYNYYVPATVNGYGAPKEPHSFSGSTNPFVNSAAGDFHLTAAGISLLANKGQDMGSEYSLDADGNTRGSGGGWDIGAFESGGASPSPTATPSPSASPTATPTATPAPTPTPRPSVTPAPTPPTVVPTPSPAAKFKIGDWCKATSDINIRSTPAGNLMGSQASGATGQVVDGPQIKNFNGVPVTWWGLSMSASPSGWVGEDYLAASPSPTPSPTPTPSATPAPLTSSFHSWLGKVNTKISTDSPTEAQLQDWVKSNPPTADQ